MLELHMHCRVQSLFAATHQPADFSYPFSKNKRFPSTMKRMRSPSLNLNRSLTSFGRVIWHLLVTLLLAITLLSRLKTVTFNSVGVVSKNFRTATGNRNHRIHRRDGMENLEEAKRDLKRLERRIRKIEDPDDRREAWLHLGRLKQLLGVKEDN